MQTSLTIPRRRILAGGAVAAIGANVSRAQPSRPAFRAPVSRAVLLATANTAIHFGEGLQVGDASQLSSAGNAAALLTAHLDEIGANDVSPALIQTQLNARPDLVNPSRETVLAALSACPGINAARATAALYRPTNITFADAAGAMSPSGLRVVEQRALSVFGASVSVAARMRPVQQQTKPPRPPNTNQPPSNTDVEAGATAAGAMVAAGSALAVYGQSAQAVAMMGAEAAFVVSTGGIALVLVGFAAAGVVWYYATMGAKPMDPLRFETIPPWGVFREA